MMAALDLLCSSSAYGESFPTVLGEAMACAVPCVTTDVGDSSWIVDKTGLVVPPRDPEALATALVTLLKLGINERRALGKEARERVIQHFSLPSVIKDYESLYESTLQRESV
jgi:glycosyltransferase involved in cell wall biosynthesis